MYSLYIIIRKLQLWWLNLLSTVERAGCLSLYSGNKQTLCMLDHPKQMAYDLSTNDKSRGFLRLEIHRYFLQTCICDHLHFPPSYVWSDLNLGFDIDYNRPDLNYSQSQKRGEPTPFPKLQINFLSQQSCAKRKERIQIYSDYYSLGVSFNFS